jgi:hypothetical protein
VGVRGFYGSMTRRLGRAEPALLCIGCRHASSGAVAFCCVSGVFLVSQLFVLLVAVSSHRFRCVGLCVHLVVSLGVSTHHIW